MWTGCVFSNDASILVSCQDKHQKISRMNERLENRDLHANKLKLSPNIQKATFIISAIPLLERKKITPLSKRLNLYKGYKLLKHL